MLLILGCFFTFFYLIIFQVMGEESSLGSGLVGVGLLWAHKRSHTEEKKSRTKTHNGLSTQSRSPSKPLLSFSSSAESTSDS